MLDTPAPIHSVQRKPFLPLPRLAGTVPASLLAGASYGELGDAECVDTYPTPVQGSMREDAQHTSAASALSIEITAIVVEPFFRRRGIARAILAAALAATRELGCKLILRNVQNPTIERHARELGFADEPTAKHLNMVFNPSAT